MSNIVQTITHEEEIRAELAAKSAGDSTQLPGIEALLRAEPVEHCLIWR